MGRVNIRHHISNITTPNDDDCWAAATAMVMKRHSSAGTDHVKNLARAANIPLDQGTLPDESVPLLARVVRFAVHDFQTEEVTLAKMTELLGRGPVVAFGFFNFPGDKPAFKHAVSVLGLEGDASDRGTIITLNDPSSDRNPFSDDWEHFAVHVADITFLYSY